MSTIAYATYPLTSSRDIVWGTTDTTAGSTTFPTYTGTHTGDIWFDDDSSSFPRVTDPWAERDIEALEKAIEKQKESINVKDYKVWECYHMRDDDDKLVKKACHKCKCRISEKIEYVETQRASKQTQKNTNKKIPLVEGPSITDWQPMTQENGTFTFRTSGTATTTSSSLFWTSGSGTSIGYPTDMQFDFEGHEYTDPRNPLP